jgi:hypothetical protein
MMNLSTKEMPKFHNKYLLQIHTRYFANKTWDAKVPKERVGDKKYIGIIHANKYLMKLCDVNPEEFLKANGIELVERDGGKTKYDGEKSTHPTILKTHAEFKTTTSVFNKRYGHGNWRIVGPRGLQRILKSIEPQPNTVAPPFTFVFNDFDREQYIERYPGGVPVTIVVNEPYANISKQLFKVVLKG